MIQKGDYPSYLSTTNFQMFISYFFTFNTKIAIAQVKPMLCLDGV